MNHSLRNLPKAYEIQVSATDLKYSTNFFNFKRRLYGEEQCMRTSS